LIAIVRNLGGFAQPSLIPGPDPRIQRSGPFSGWRLHVRLRRLRDAATDASLRDKLSEAIAAKSENERLQKLISAWHRLRPGKTP
jgi:hypothetical protein